MTNDQIGMALAFGTTVCWTFSSIFFEQASRRIGSVPLNLIRLVIALAFLAAFVVVAQWVTGSFTHIPSGRQATMIALSGFIGFFVCDLFLFRSYVLIGARLAQLVMCLAPMFAGGFGYLIAHETLSWMDALGIAITLAGVAWVIGERSPVPAQGAQVADEGAAHPHHARRETITCLLFALIGAATQGLSMPLVKIGFKALEPGEVELPPAEVTLLRAASGVVCFAVFIALARLTRKTLAGLRDGRAMGYATAGAFLGPFMGVSLWIASTKFVETSIAATVTCLVPITIIPLAIIVRKERVSWRAIVGSAIAVAGVIVLAWW
jgi:drug/metabolite transporter (DMT)-like permease